MSAGSAEPEPEPEPDNTPDTLEELFAEGNESYQQIVSDTLNDNLYEKIVMKTVGFQDYDMNKVEDAHWEIISEDGENIDSINISYFYNLADNSRAYRVASVEPKVNISISDLVSPDTTTLEEAFDTANRGGARYTRGYSFSYDPTIQEERSELLDAVNTKLAADGLINPVTEDTVSFIRDDGGDLDATLNGTARRIVVLNLTENGYEEYTVRIKELQNNNNDTTLIENLNEGNYYEVEADAESGQFTGNRLKNMDMPENEASSEKGTRFTYVDKNENGELVEYEIEI